MKFWLHYTTSTDKTLWQISLFWDGQTAFMSSRCLLIHVIFSESKDPMRKDHLLKDYNFSQLLDSSATYVLAVKARKPAARVKPRRIAEQPAIAALLRVWFTQLVHWQRKRSQKFVLPKVHAASLTPRSWSLARQQKVKHANITAARKTCATMAQRPWSAFSWWWFVPWWDFSDKKSEKVQWSRKAVFLPSILWERKTQGFSFRLRF